MPLAVLVVHCDAALEQRGQPGGIERGGEVDREERLGLIEQETAIAVGAGDEGVAGFGGEGQGLAFEFLGAVEQLA